jgi:hypothetical protein
MSPAKLSWQVLSLFIDSSLVTALGAGIDLMIEAQTGEL